MSTTTRFTRTGLFAATLAMAPLAQATDWDWAVTPYLWATTVSTDLREDVPPVESESEFADIISKIDMAFLGHVEGQGDQFGMFADIIYLSLGDEKTHVRSSSESSLDSSVFELAGVWSPGEERNKGIEVFGGLRHIIVDLNVKLDPVNPSLPNAQVGFDQSYSDLMLGARYQGSFNAKWGYSIRVDGSFGDTDGTISTSAYMNYKTGNGAWVFGYRYMDAELKARDADLDLTLSGPAFGYTFVF